MSEQPLHPDNAPLPDAAILAQNNKKYLIVLGSIVLILCVCVGLATLAGSLVLLPTPTVAASIPTRASTFTLTPITPAAYPSLTPLPVQKAGFPSQTALVLTLTIQAGYSRTPEPPTPTNPRPTYTPGTEPEPTRVKVTFAAHTPGSDCNPAYPTLCLKSRLSCHQIGIHNFTVLPPDPFGYDNDEDGKGCE